MKIGKIIFAPRLMPTLLTLVMLPILLWLGTWQVERLYWKRALMATISERVHDAPLNIPLAADIDADYRPAKATGTFRHDLSLFVFGSDITSGKGGYHVFTPLQLVDGQYLLVDRGWIAYDQKPNEFEQPAGSVEVHGILRTPHAPSWIQPHNNPAKGEWYNADLVAMAEADKLPAFLPYVLEAEGQKEKVPIGSQTRLTLPNDHFSYAVTWYSFALILLVIYGLSSLRKSSAD